MGFPTRQQRPWFGRSQSTASVSGLCRPARTPVGADRESGTHIPVRIGEVAVTAGMNGKS
ncbi:hypothetical protein ACH4S8_27395 [Streptomyces sp. NPDC021080]|uniref:hypothetical protein n=1 Tax=Streptomyces sp. NPDC021080 TaxID=3365110 RepID=UPI00379DCCF9